VRRVNRANVPACNPHAPIARDFSSRFGSTSSVANRAASSASHGASRRARDHPHRWPRRPL